MLFASIELRRKLQRAVYRYVPPQLAAVGDPAGLSPRSARRAPRVIFSDFVGKPRQVSRPNLPESDRSAAMMLLLATGAAALLLLAPTASAFKLIIDSNTMEIDDLKNASTGALRADGSYSIFVNTVPQASDALWKTYIAGVSPADGSSASLEFTEENPGSYDSCKMYARIMGKPPTASMGYHETGLVAGGTLISDAEIDKQAKECNAPVNVLTRSFCKTESNKFSPGTDESWIVNTTRALANPNVYAVQMEFTPSWPLNGMQGCGAADLMSLAMSKNKTTMLLLPVCVVSSRTHPRTSTPAAAQGHLGCGFRSVLAAEVSRTNRWRWCHCLLQVRSQQEQARVAEHRGPRHRAHRQRRAHAQR